MIARPDSLIAIFDTPLITTLPPHWTLTDWHTWTVTVGTHTVGTEYPGPIYDENDPDDTRWCAYFWCEYETAIANGLDALDRATDDERAIIADRLSAQSFTSAEYPDPIDAYSHAADNLEDSAIAMQRIADVLADIRQHPDRPDNY